ncbi:MAG: ATP-binding cassette domain-containing protein [bacterium]|nr:ATP-binding cassette domain-containing protein [bacterium]
MTDSFVSAPRESAFDYAIEVMNIVTRFGDQTVHDGVSFKVKPGRVVSLIGGSGTGKSTLLKEILNLQLPQAGSIRLLGVNVLEAEEDQLQLLRRRYGVLFQGGALFSGLTVGENIAAPIRESMDIEEALLCKLVELRLSLTGLSADTAVKMPSELSGGMVKRVALARAMALEPEVLFLDEPTSGLDPVNARAFDSLIRTLADALGLTVLMVTHDLASIKGISDQIVVLADGKVIADGTYQEVVKTEHTWIAEYFSQAE